MTLFDSIRAAARQVRSPLRHIDADPDQMVADAVSVLQKVAPVIYQEQHPGRVATAHAICAHAAAQIAAAEYLRAHNTR